ncbi:MAG: 3-oxoacyl-ACP reductase FabG [Oligoflexia bacterium]|nr:3-oxoacyl-ACP reductase FabG [Oligoflexia bacterium]
MNIKYSFENYGVVVTGGAQGIGFETARSFLQAGAKVSIWDYSTDAIKTAQKELSQFKAQAHFAQVHVTKSESVQQASANLPFGVDVLINNAGITRDKSFAKMTEEDFKQVIDTNLTGLFHVTKNLMEKFKTDTFQKRIINISSVVALYGNFGQTNYVASKSGVIGFTKTLARELSKKGFTVNAVAPGFIQTAMVAKMPPEVLQAMAAKVPVGRLGETNDISNACLFLASQEASYINGIVFSVDGGLVC